MAHLRDRFCLVPFCDLTDCPEAVHHAIGSPYFDPLGRPLFANPIIIAIRADIVDESLPRSTMLAVSCNTRPYQSYGPVIRRVFEASQPHKYPEVRRGYEGVMEVGDVRAIPPGALQEQSDQILLGCVTPMTGGTNRTILNTVLQNYAHHFAQTPPGSTLRMPLIGTGKARTEEATEQVFREVVDLTLSHFYSILLRESERISPRRLLLVHPLEYESQLIFNTLAHKALFFSFLDKLGVFTTDKRLIYGIAHGETPEYCFVDGDKFTEALQYFDSALDKLLQGKRKKALQEAAQGAQIEPALGCMYIYLHSFANRKTGLIDAITREACVLAGQGKIRDACCAAITLEHLGGKKKEREFVAALRNCYVDYCNSALESRLLYEHYMIAEQALTKICQGTRITQASLQQAGDIQELIASADLVDTLQPLQQLREKIPLRLIENTFHIVIRKFMADRIETLGARRALENLQELEQHERIKLTDNQRQICAKLQQLAWFVEQNQDNLQDFELRKNILDKLLEVLPDHGTLRLEAARFYLRGSDGQHQRAKTLSRAEIFQAWGHLEIGYQKNPRDYGILSYLGFLIFLQGHKFLSAAEDFYTLFGKLANEELSDGRYGIRRLKAPDNSTIEVPIRDSFSKLAHEYYQKYRDTALEFAKLAKTIGNSEFTAAITAYQQVMNSLAEVGRYDLIQLYDEILGEPWVALMCRHQKTMGNIPLPFGEISLDFIVHMYKRIRRWFKYGKLKSAKLKETIPLFIEKLGKQMKRG